MTGSANKSAQQRHHAARLPDLEATSTASASASASARLYFRRTASEDGSEPHCRKSRRAGPRRLPAGLAMGAERTVRSRQRHRASAYAHFKCLEKPAAHCERTAGGQNDYWRPARLPRQQASRCPHSAAFLAGTRGSRFAARWLSLVSNQRGCARFSQMALFCSTTHTDDSLVGFTVALREAFDISVRIDRHTGKLSLRSNSEAATGLSRRIRTLATTANANRHALVQILGQVRALVIVHEVQAWTGLAGFRTHQPTSLRAEGALPSALLTRWIFVTSAQTDAS